MTLDDSLWDLLDAVHLGEFFDSHGLPPILFPIMILALVGLLLFFFVFGGLGGGLAPAGCNNDGICDGPAENYTNCADDCEPPTPPPPQSKTIRVVVSGGKDCTSITVALKEKSGASIGSPKTLQARSFAFDSVKATTVYAEVSSSQSQQSSQKSSEINTASDDTISVSLPEAYCPPPITTGSLKVVITDRANGQSLGANVVLFDDGDSQKSTMFVNGEYTFTNLDANEWYYLTATAEGGYEQYNGRSDKVYVEPNKQALKSIPMSRQITPVAAGGQLEVCVRDSNGVPIEHSGEVGVYDIEGVLKTTGKLKDCPLFRRLATSNGCFIFNLTAGVQYAAAVRMAPSGCTITPKSQYVTVSTTTRQLIRLNVSCNLVGSIRAKIVGNNSRVLTRNCTVELYYKNNTKIKTMNTSAGSNYTEYVSLKDGDRVYIVAKNVPAGYVTTTSSTEKIDAGENITKELRLDIWRPPPPNLTIVGPAISSTIMQKGENFTVTATSVTLLGAAVTTGVTMTCEMSNVRRTANFTNGKWRCNMTAPTTLGQKQVVLKATKSGATAASHTFTTYVVNSSVSNRFIITPDLANPSYNTNGPRVYLYFKINQTNGTIGAPSTTSTAVTDLDAGYVEVRYAGGLVVNASLVKVATGLFKSEFDVPFRGTYEYSVITKKIVNNLLYMGLYEWGFIASYGKTSSLTCAIYPEITKPGGLFNVTAAFTLNNVRLADQHVRVNVSAGPNSQTTRLAWNSTTQSYSETVSALSATSPECKYTVTCYSAVDPTLRATKNLSVVNPYAIGVNTLNCPSNTFNCGTLATAAEKLSAARGCYRRYVDPYGGFISNYNAAVSCAGQALSACDPSARPTYNACKQAMSFKVRKTRGNKWNQTPEYLTFVVDGDNTSDGKTTTGASLSYTKPTLSGLAGNFSLAGLIQLSGGRPNGDNVSCNLDDTECWTSTVRVNIGKTTGDLSVKAYCDLACGNRKGDLDGDNVTADDEDMYLMRGLLDTQRMIGRPTYDPTPACADVTGDGVITTEDMECLSSNFQNCKNCSARMQQEHAYSASMEICGDGRDNNCDGQTDRETYQNSVGDFYSVSNGIMLDTCDCNWRTPCEMLYDRRGGLGNYSKEDDVKRCAKIETANNMDYNYHSTVYDWYTYSEWKCTSERQGWRLTCNGQSYNCESGSWVKEGALSVNYPPNPLTGGTATPVTKCSVVYNAQLSFFGADDHYAYWSWPSGGIPRSGPDLAFICDGTSIYSCGWEKDATAALPVIVEPVGAVRGMWRCSFYNSTANTRHGYWTRPY